MTRVEPIKPLRAIAALLATPLVFAAFSAAILSIWISAPFPASFPLLFFIYAVPGELIAIAVGLPALFLMRRNIRREWYWLSLSGGLLVATSVALLATAREPVLGGLTDNWYAYLDTHHPKFSSAWTGEILELSALAFVVGAVAGMIFWALAAQPWHRAKA